jgi:hypothetical protein
MPITPIHYSPIALLRKGKLTVEVSNWKPLEDNLCVISFIMLDKRYTYIYNVTPRDQIVLRRTWRKLFKKPVYATLAADGADKDGYPSVLSAE